MEAISSSKCFHHPFREAAARCPECRRFFCRECITEHEDRILCAQCLAKKSEKKKTHGRSRIFLARSFHGFLGIWITMFFFYYLAKMLLSFSDEFHEGSIWNNMIW